MNNYRGCKAAPTFQKLLKPTVLSFTPTSQRNDAQIAILVNSIFAHLTWRYEPFVYNNSETSVEFAGPVHYSIAEFIAKILC